ncbi:MAG: arginine--tRNA ligase, partial [Actinomycetota bacterium]
MSKARETIVGALCGAVESLDIRIQPGAFVVERPARLEHGDFSTNIAMVSAKLLGEMPRSIAEKICAYLAENPVKYQKRVEIA